VDLIGVRILVYFPDDVFRVVQLIEDSGIFEIFDAAVSYSRNRTDLREKDNEEQLAGAKLNYTDGLWSLKSVSTADIIHRCKNSGYRAAHLHVMLKSPADQNDTIGANQFKKVGKPSGSKFYGTENLYG
jgi:ppGpp synthetase/RelA/SpoT-type nucleotidyltranferase